MELQMWSPTGKARACTPKCVSARRRGTRLTPERGDIPAKSWRIHPRPKAVAFCCRGEAPPGLCRGASRKGNVFLIVPLDPTYPALAGPRSRPSAGQAGKRQMNAKIQPKAKV